MQKIKRVIASLVFGVMILLPTAQMAQAFDVTIYGVANNIYYRNDIRPTFSASDGAQVVAATLNGQSFTSGTWIGNEGLYGLAVTGYKQGSAPKTVNRNFTIDKTAPQVNIGGIDNNQTYNHSVNPTFSAIDNYAVQSVFATLNGQPFSSGTTVSSDGLYGLAVTAVDKAGNSATINSNFTIQSDQPINGKDGKDGKDGKNGKNGQNGKDGTNGQNGSNGADGVTTTVTETVYRYLGGVSRAYAQTPVAEELAKPLEEPVPDYLSTIKVISVENAEDPKAEIDTCHNIRIIGRAKEGLLVILYLKREGSETPVIGFTKATSGDVFEFVSDQPLKAGEYTIYGKAAEEGGKTGPILMLKDFEVLGCKWWVVWVWILIVLIILGLAFLVWWYLRRRMQREDEQIEEDINPPHITESRL